MHKFSKQDKECQSFFYDPFFVAIICLGWKSDKKEDKNKFT